ncbi:MAG: hypothetical protein JWQ66_35 [Mucilaginibacter sp.]|nr:hypothetical protein [Mucilaginibacter sp.]
MKTDNRDSIASTILNYLLQLIGVAIFYWLLIYTTINFWFFSFIRTITKVRYEAGPHFTRELYFLLLIYTLFCYFANRFLLDIYHRKTARQLIISIVADYFIWPLEVLIMLIYNNLHITTIVVNISTLYNIYLITLLLIIKNVIAVKILSAKKVSGEKINYKSR